jgi:hypothetical protein
MVTSKYAFVLDLQSTQSQISIPVTKGDTARVWYISLADGGKPFTIEDGWLAKVEIKRPTGTFLMAFCPIEKNSVIKYDFAQDSITKNTAAVEGVHNCSVVLTTVDGVKIGSAKFSMIVDDNVINSDDINLSDDDLDFIEQITIEEQTRQEAEKQRQEYYEDFKDRLDTGEFIREVLDGVEEAIVPLILPHAVSYGTDYYEGIVGDIDTLRLDAFNRTPNAGDVFFFIAKTRMGDVVGVTAKVLGLQENDDGLRWVQFSVEDATLFHNSKEISNLQETIDGLAIPLHYNYAVTLKNVAYDGLFNWQGIPGNPYTNSFRTSDFSRTPKLGDVFSLLFTDKNQNKVYAFARITASPNDAGFTPFAIEQAMMMHNAEEISEIKDTIDGLGTESWTFIVANEDGSTTPVTKKVYVK